MGFSRIAASLLVSFALGAPAGAQGSAFLVDSVLDRLYSVNLQVGNASLIGSTFNNGFTAPAGLAWNDATRELWSVDFAGGEVGTLDPASGVFTQRFTVAPLSGWQGLAWDPTTSLLYLANQNDDLYSLDPVTGSSRRIGSTGASLITGLDVDAAGDLWGVEFFNGGILRIDKSTGVSTRVATTIAGIQGLGIDASTGTFFAVNSQDNRLYTIDATNGSARVIGGLGAQVSVAKGFDLAVAVCAGSFAYSGQGCLDSSATQLAMVFQGTPCIGSSVEVGMSAGGTAPYSLRLGLSDQRWNGFALPLDFAAFGAPGCTLYTSDEVSLGPIFPGLRLVVQIPPEPLLRGRRVFWQGILVDFALSSTLPIASSDLLTLDIG